MVPTDYLVFFVKYRYYTLYLYVVYNLNYNIFNSPGGNKRINIFAPVGLYWSWCEVEPVEHMYL